ncbi:WYL domain-containing protein [Limnothrix sp. FACHB-881]|uniref:helix-turn-helix transcriptional regulator n=1 Tax=Limnothrix sp. FACHB-881 TaxID=2692819 RepID=UPI001686F181|nr:WYL domain-containing protein [Limnothrix sp. FACHB-881]MBD2636491.1 WYL domain-containing protein [Limnothrix sp. FACHB-881]
MATRSRHGYEETMALDRLMLLVALLAQDPGSGAIAAGGLEAIAAALRDRAAALGRPFPEDYPSIPTLRKDLATLRDYGLLGERMYRWGYYLGAGALTVAELTTALNGLRLLAIDLGDPQVAEGWAAIERRLKAWDADLDGQLSYPLRRSLSRPVSELDPATRMAKGQPWDSLAGEMVTIEQAILTGQAIELKVARSPQLDDRGERERLYPLQLLFYDVGWYLLYEKLDSGQFATRRIDRLSAEVRWLPMPPRGLRIQRQRLRKATGLLSAGWGLFLGEAADQIRELAGQEPLQLVVVRFRPPTARFIAEGDHRHPTQRLTWESETSGEPSGLEFSVKLPRRSLGEFERWVRRYGSDAVVLEPPELVARFRQMAIALALAYGVGAGGSS